MEAQQTEKDSARSVKRLPSLVAKLSNGEHNLEVSTRSRESGIEELKKSIDLGYLRLRFTETLGETELGFQLDRDDSDFTKIDFEKQTGKLRVVGMPISLDSVRVRCVATVDASTLKGTGHLELIQ